MENDHLLWYVCHSLMMALYENQNCRSKWIFIWDMLDEYVTAWWWFSIRTETVTVSNNFLANTVYSRYLELQGTLWNTSRYPYFDISDLQNWVNTNSINHI